MACQEAVSDLPFGRSRHHCPLRPHLEYPELLVLELAMLPAVRPAGLEALATAMLQCLVGLLVELAVYGLLQTYQLGISFKHTDTAFSDARSKFHAADAALTGPYRELGSGSGQSSLLA